MALRDVRTDREVLLHAINDAINIFVREVLLPEGIIDQQGFDRLDDDRLMAAKYAIADKVAAWWEHCQIDDSAGPVEL
jgi:hypothetical protein